jgi:hypothetical protein
MAAHVSEGVRGIRRSHDRIIASRQDMANTLAAPKDHFFGRPSTSSFVETAMATT